MQLKATQPRLARVTLWVFVAGCAALLLAGCTSGTLSGTQQSCQSNFGVLDEKKVSCSGSVDTVRGSPSLSVIEIDEELNGAFQLKTIIRARRGTAKAHVVDVNDKRVRGEISPGGDPLRIVAVVYPEEVGGTDDEEEKIGVQLEVPEGEEVRDLQYEATLVAEED